MRAKPHGIGSVTLAGEATFHSRFPYWHVTGARGCRYAVGDTFSGEIYRVDLETGERVLLTRGHRSGRKGAHSHQRLRPDGEVVLFNSNTAGNPNLYLVEVE